MTLKITAMRTVRGIPNRGGSKIIAHFDFITDDLGFKSCVLSLNPEGAFRVWTPLIDPTAARDERKTAQVGVYWRKDGTLHDEVLAAAVAMYRAFNSEDEPANALGCAVQETMEAAGL